MNYHAQAAEHLISESNGPNDTSGWAIFQMLKAVTYALLAIALEIKERP